MNALTYFARQTRAVRNPLHAGLKAWEARAVFRAAGDLKNQRVLDLGAGDGYYAGRALRREADRVTCIEPNANQPNHLATRIQVLDHDLESYRWTNIQSDVTFALGVLEFLKDPDEFLRRLAHTSARRIVILYPPRGPAAQLYRRYHQQHGFRIHLFNPERISHELAPRRRTRRIAPHPYAYVEAYE